MQEIGRLLREAREAKGLTVDDIQQATKIRARYLEAMEQGRFEALPGEAYVKGFLRNYAETVGLPADDVVARYTAVLARSEAERAGERAAPGGRSRTRMGPGLERRVLVWRLALFAAGAAVLVLAARLAGWPGGHPAPGPPGIAQEGRDAEVSPPGEPGSLEGEALPVSPEVAPALSEPSETPPATVAQANGGGVEPLPQERHELSAQVSERCWVRVVADGKRVFERSMLPGESGSWSADETIRIKVGNASGIDITFNGIHIGTLGKSGQVVERTFPESP